MVLNKTNETPKRIRDKVKCRVPNCERKVYKSDYCKTHWDVTQKWGLKLND